MTQDKELSVEEFGMFQKLVYDEVGISLADHKRTLVQSRLRKWLKEFSLDSYKDLYIKIKNDTSGQMLILLINAITTNVTSFFREENQWIYLQEHIQEVFDAKKKRIRIWSAACSSGQEPYTIIMFLREHIPDFDKWDVKILATDISEDILSKAIKGVYSQKEIEGMPHNMLAKYFNSTKDEKGNEVFVVKDALKKDIKFRIFNLVTGDFSMFKNCFDAIFCRNVMIYFDRPTQSTLLDKFSKLLDTNSRLFIGHSESIHKKEDIYKMVQPSIYRKK